MCVADVENVFLVVEKKGLLFTAAFRGEKNNHQASEGVLERTKQGRRTVDVRYYLYAVPFSGVF